MGGGGSLIIVLVLRCKGNNEKKTSNKTCSKDYTGNLFLGSTQGNLDSNFLELILDSVISFGTFPTPINSPQTHFEKEKEKDFWRRQSLELTWRWVNWVLPFLHHIIPFVLFFGWFVVFRPCLCGAKFLVLGGCKRYYLNIVFN